MRSIWNGAISFGLVSVPCKLIAATSSHDVELHQVHTADSGRVRYVKRCEVCHEDLAPVDIGKGYAHPSGQIHVLTEDELEVLASENTKEIDVVAFVPANSVDPIMVEKSYYLQADTTYQPRAYRLLTAAMLKTKREAIVRFTLRSVERLGVLRVRRINGVDVLTLFTLLWADEIREPTFTELDGTAPFQAAELAAAKALVESLAADWRPDEYLDERQADIKELLANPIKRRPRKKVEPAVDDLLTALKESAKRKRSVA